MIYNSMVDAYNKAASFVNVHIRPIATTTIMGAGILGAVYNPIPITTNWGDIAAKDFASKIAIVQAQKERVRAAVENGILEPKEVLNLIANASPSPFVFARVPEAKVAGILDAFDNPNTTKAPLEDYLKREYSSLFDRGGPLHSYFRQGWELQRAAYASFLHRESLTMNEWETTFEGKIKSSRKGFIEWYVVNHAGIPSTSSVYGVLEQELSKLEMFFGSSAAQRDFKGKFESLGREQNLLWNALFFALAAGMLVGWAYTLNPLKRRPEQLKLNFT